MSRIVLEDRIETPLGAMVVLADEGKLIGLSFDDPPGWVLKRSSKHDQDYLYSEALDASFPKLGLDQLTVQQEEIRKRHGIVAGDFVVRVAIVA